jgi:hypothetical protein
MNRKLVLLGLIFLIPIMSSGCFYRPGGFMENDHPRRYYYEHRDQHQDYHHDHFDQQGRKGQRR